MKYRWRNTKIAFNPSFILLIGVACVLLSLNFCKGVSSDNAMNCGFKNLSAMRGRKRKRIDVKAEEMQRDLYDTVKDFGESKERNPKLMTAIL